MTVTYLKNRSPTNALDQITSYEAWHGKKPDLTNLHTFGCAAYHHIEGARRKLDDKSLKCQFLGYEGVNQFRLWNGKKVLISSHVQWDEVVIEAGEYEEDLSVLTFADQMNGDQTNDQPSPSNTTENAEIAEIQISDDHQTTKTPPPTTPEHTPIPPATPQRDESQPSEPESSESSSSDSDAPSGRPKRATAGPVDYRALNDPWAKGNKRGFAIRANRVHIESDTPQTVEEARTSPDWEQWELAFRSEVDAHTKNNTFTLGTPPPNRRVLPTRWVTTIKRGPQGEVIKYKARWVCKGFRQEQGVDYDETFASVVRAITIKMLLALAAKYDYEAEQMDVVTAFLEAHIKEEVWVQQPPGFEQKGPNGTFLACRLNKALYGLKQAPREWYATLKTYLISISYQRVEIDHSVFTHENDTIIAVYVNDLLILGPDISDIQALKLQFAERFQMKDLGSIGWYLGMHIIRDRAERTIWITKPHTSSEPSSSLVWANAAPPNASNALVRHLLKLNTSANVMQPKKQPSWFKH